MNLAAIDFGITNIDTILRRGAELVHTRISNTGQPLSEQLPAIMQTLTAEQDNIRRVAVTGGRYRSLPDQVDGIELVKVSEVAAIGRGGLYLSKMEAALVVSAGSGTAMVAARGISTAFGVSTTAFGVSTTALSVSTAHVTGSAVGGGTLQGLGRLLLGTADALQIDELAMQGSANQVDLTLVEAVGSAVGKLPLDANAVNFGRLATEAAAPSPQDVAAGLVRLVGQVIAVIAINAAQAEGLAEIVMTGHLVDLPSVCRVLTEVAGYYQASIQVPPRPGIGTAVGALLCLETV